MEPINPALPLKSPNAADDKVKSYSKSLDAEVVWTLSATYEPPRESWRLVGLSQATTVEA
jgi:hypothetical protein